MFKTKKLGRGVILSPQLQVTKQSREVWAYVSLQVLYSGNAKMNKREEVLAGKIAWVLWEPMVLGAQDFWLSEQGPSSRWEIFLKALL